MLIALWTLALLHMLLLGITVLPVTRSDSWWIRALGFPRLQLALFSCVLLAGDLVAVGLGGSVFAWTLGAIAAGCLVHHARWILPYTPLHPTLVRTASRERDPRAQLRVMMSTSR